MPLFLFHGISHSIFERDMRFIVEVFFKQQIRRESGRSIDAQFNNAEIKNCRCRSICGNLCSAHNDKVSCQKLSEVGSRSGERYSIAAITRSFLVMSDEKVRMKIMILLQNS